MPLFRLLCHCSPSPPPTYICSRTSEYTGSEYFVPPYIGGFLCYIVTEWCCMFVSFSLWSCCLSFHAFKFESRRHSSYCNVKYLTKFSLTQTVVQTVIVRANVTLMLLVTSQSLTLVHEIITAMAWLNLSGAQCRNDVWIFTNLVYF